MERSVEEKRAFQTRRSAMAIKVRAQQARDRQKVPVSEKRYVATASEISILLDAGADIVQCDVSTEKTFIRLMYEAVPIDFEGEISHPRLSGTTKKAG